MSTDMPVFSIVTPSLNQARFVIETIESVIYQEGPFFIDYIIMDGVSKDSTLEIVRRYSEGVKNNEFDLKCTGVDIRYFSSKDKGQADAINNGFKIAKGNIYAFINSDDIYEAGAFNRVLKTFDNKPNIGVVYGNGFYIDENSEITGLYRSKDVNRHNVFEACFICQPTLFMRREVYEVIGSFNININNSFDYDYWLRVYSSRKVGFEFLRDVLASSRMHRGNKTTNNRKEIYLEYFSLMKSYGQRVPTDWKVNFVRETSYLTKIVLKIARIVERPFVAFVGIYSILYYWYHRKVS